MAVMRMRYEPDAIVVDYHWTHSLVRTVDPSNPQESRMLRHSWIVAAFLGLSIGAASAQAPAPPAQAPAAAPAANPAAIAAARSLVNTMKLADQFRGLMPLIMQGLKPAIVQGRPEVERDLDAMMPKLLDAFNPYYTNMVDGIVSVYATNFTPEELAEMEAFYQRPTGQKMLAKTQVVMQQSMQVGQMFGQKAAEDLRNVAIEELRKKGHKI
jgi:hypothetical protein